MSLLFDSNDFLTVNQAVVSAAPLTMSVWFNPPSIQDALMFSLSDRSRVDQFIVTSLSSTGLVTGDVRQGVFRPLRPTNAYQLNAWNHVAFVLRSTTDRSIYLNKTGRADSTQLINPTGLDTTTIGRNVRSGSPFNVNNVQLAEAAIWSTDLTDAEVQRLASGERPTVVRPGSLALYQSLVEQANEPRSVGPALSVVSDPVASEHPPLISPLLSRRRRLAS